MIWFNYWHFHNVKLWFAENVCNKDSCSLIHDFYLLFAHLDCIIDWLIFDDHYEHLISPYLNLLTGPLVMYCEARVNLLTSPLVMYCEAPVNLLTGPLVMYCKAPVNLLTGPLVMYCKAPVTAFTMVSHTYKLQNCLCVHDNTHNGFGNITSDVSRFQTLNHWWLLWNGCIFAVALGDLVLVLCGVHNIVWHESAVHDPRLSSRCIRTSLRSHRSASFVNVV